MCVGLFQGTIQAMSRSYFAKIIPQEKSGEYFGVYDIFGKGASFMGTFLVALVADLTGRENLGVSVLTVMFAIGFVLFLVAVRVGRGAAPSVGGTARTAAEEEKAPSSEAAGAPSSAETAK